MVEYNSGFNKRLLLKMEEYGVTQADLCRSTGLASSMISHYCTGQRVPSVQVAAKIAKALNTSIDFLASGNPKVKRKPVTGTSHVAEKTQSYKSDRQLKESAEDEALLTDMYRSLNTDGKEKVNSYIEDLLYIEKYRE